MQGIALAYVYNKEKKASGDVVVRIILVLLLRSSPTLNGMKKGTARSIRATPSYRM